MHVHRENQPAKELYQKMGFEVILPWLMVFYFGFQSAALVS